MPDGAPLVKIDGVQDPKHAMAAAEAGADFVGMIFAESKRQVDLAAARKIRAALGPRREVLDATAEAFEEAVERGDGPLLVGVFVNQSPEEIARMIEVVNLDIVQLSGGEHPAFIKRIARPVLRVIHVGKKSTAEGIIEDAARPPAAVTVLDTKSKLPGGTGETFDWSIAEKVGRVRPLMLAGGLTPDNVSDAVAQVTPWAVDVSSGVESDGRKDVEKIEAFTAAAKGRAILG